MKKKNRKKYIQPLFDKKSLFALLRIFTFVVFIIMPIAFSFGFFFSIAIIISYYLIVEGLSLIFKGKSIIISKEE